jgi:membrane-associated protease RseP (regulator of RpoE activity)
MHFIIAFVLICVVFMGFGTADANSDRWTLQSVSGPALDAGLKPGDRIISIDGKHYSSFDNMSAAVRQLPGQHVQIVVDRAGAQRTLTATLDKSNPTTGKHVGYLGVSPRFDLVREGPVQGVVDGVKTMGTTAKESIIGLGRVFSPTGISRYVDNLTTSNQPTGSAASPSNQDRPTSMVGIVQIGSQAAKDGIVNVLYLLFVVNMFIGLFNLTPLLPFDGGHVAIATYEKIRSMIAGRRYQADVAKLMPLTYAVVMVLGLLFITSIYLDIAKPISIR